MIDPPRLSSTGGPIADLLRAARLDEPPADAQQRMLAATGIAVGAGSLAQTPLTKVLAALGVKKTAVGIVTMAVLAGGGVTLGALDELARPPAPLGSLSSASHASVRAQPNDGEGPGSRSEASVELPPSSPPNGVSSSDVSGVVVSPSAHQHRWAPEPPSSAPPRLGRPSVPLLASTELPASTSVVARTTLGEEIDLLDRARAALLGNDSRAAATLLADYDRRFPRGELRPEAVRLRRLVRASEPTSIP